MDVAECQFRGCGWPVGGRRCQPAGARLSWHVRRLPGEPGEFCVAAYRPDSADPRGLSTAANYIRRRTQTRKSLGPPAAWLTAWGICDPGRVRKASTAAR